MLPSPLLSLPSPLLSLLCSLLREQRTWKSHPSSFSEFVPVHLNPFGSVLFRNEHSAQWGLNNAEKKWNDFVIPMIWKLYFCW